jgi:flagellar biosynthesis protein
LPNTTPSDGPDDEPKVAVALKYAHKVDPAPRVIAKGAGAIAEQIRAIAESRGIAINKDVDLAQLLMAVDLDSPIPIEAYEAVARILSYIYRANQQLKTAGTTR